jgi:hypothetical protein
MNKPFGSETAEIQAQALAHLQAAGKPQSSADIAQALTLPHPLVQTAVCLLAIDDRIKYAGRADDGKPLYSPSEEKTNG